jgi:hypothetical protein
MSDSTFYTWKAKYYRITVSEAKRLEVLVAETAKLGRLLVDQMLDMAAMRELLQRRISLAFVGCIASIYAPVKGATSGDQTRSADRPGADVNDRRHLATVSFREPW